MKIAISGATGFIGKNLTAHFNNSGHSVTPLTSETFRLSDPEFAEVIKGHQAVINLAGAPIISRWTEEYKKVLVSSRIDTTKKLVNAFVRLKERPKVFVSTSAVGIYASGRSHTEDENTPADNFLGRLCKQWEAEAFKAGDAGIRTVIFRLGIVLGKGGGALSVMLPPFRLGLGGKIGDGSQVFSWVHVEDLKRAYELAVTDATMEGIYNMTAPNPVTNKELTEAIGSALGRPTIFRVPHFALRLKYGEGAIALIEGQRVLPKRLLEHGFSFQFADIDEAIRDCLK